MARWLVALLLCCTGALAGACGGTARLLLEDKQPQLPESVAVVADPVELIAGQPATLTAVAEIGSPHGQVSYLWEVGPIGTRSTSAAQPAVLKAGSADSPDGAGADGTNRSIAITTTTLPSGSPTVQRSGQVTIEVVWNSIVQRRAYPFTVTIQPASP
jgi:hypothetical protein